MKVKLDDYKDRVLVNGLDQQSRYYDTETKDKIGILILRLIDISDSMKRNRRKKIIFEPEETMLIRHYLIE